MGSDRGCVANQPQQRSYVPRTLEPPTALDRTAPLRLTLRAQSRSAAAATHALSKAPEPSERYQV
jgi:hypothetical protein